MEDWLAARARRSPGALALIIEGKRWRYDQLNELVECCASHLSRLVPPGKHVAILLPNGLSFVCLLHAAARAGHVLVPLNNRLNPTEVQWQFAHSRSALLITTDEWIERLVAIGLSEQAMISADELFHPGEGDAPAAWPEFRLDGVQAIIYTSGTTGQPKGAMLNFNNHLWSATSSAYRLGTAADDRWLCCLPLYHVGGMAIIFRSCLYGTAVVLHDGFVEEAVARSLAENEVTLISLVPTMLRRLLAYFGEQRWPASLRHVLLGGAAAPPELVAHCHELGVPVSVTYGLSEASSQVATMPPAGSKQKPGSAGQPLLFTDIEILDSEGQAVPAGSIGEVCVSGPTVMLGYYGDEAANVQTLKGGRLHTGDMGYLDADGDLWLVQRRGDIIISGGENIYPAEVEQALRRHPAVAAVCVTGVPDPQWGQRVAAMVELKPGEILQDEALLAFGRERLAAYKLPRQVQFVDRLPLTASGKIHRRQVEERLASQAERPGMDAAHHGSAKG